MAPSNIWWWKDGKANGVRLWSPEYTWVTITLQSTPTKICTFSPKWQSCYCYYVLFLEMLWHRNIGKHCINDRESMGRGLLQHNVIGKHQRKAFMFGKHVGGGKNNCIWKHPHLGWFCLDVQIGQSSTFWITQATKWKTWGISNVLG